MLVTLRVKGLKWFKGAYDNFLPFERTEEKYFGYHIEKRLRHQTAIFFLTL